MSIPLRVHHLVKNYGHLCAVDNVSFELKPGEVFGLLGPNGAGKTSIISIIVTLEKASSGEVEVFGYNVAREQRKAKFNTGLVPQELINHGFFNIAEVLSFHSGYYGILNNKERENYLLNRLGLWEHRHKKVKQLSGGMKRRLLIAKALVHRPPLLLLDEPTAGVDIELRESLWDFVRELKEEGLSILLTTHYLEEAERLCDRVGVIHKGRLQSLGATKTLISELTQRRVYLRLKKGGDIESKQRESKYWVREEGGENEFHVPSKMRLGELLQEIDIEWSQLEDVRIQEGSLEDAFRQIVGAKL
ncbi:MAG: ABC transporter ATP-binding protein [Bdellovibrionales bacterium]|nr:ABC transporter ATP-binding protein [Bdellovibrionales bacterium]